MAEDTRSFSTLASRFCITKPVQSCHEHNERGRIQPTLDLLKNGKNVALVSDAGTPLISDPGYRLVQQCRAENIRVSGVPGPCAAVFALSISGFETDSFIFRGFLPQKKGRRRKLLIQALEQECTAIFYESPHRIVSTLEILSVLAPRREVFIGRELTKHFEECRCGTGLDIYNELNSRSSIKGEIVLIIKRGNSDSIIYTNDSVTLDSEDSEIDGPEMEDTAVEVAEIKDSQADVDES